MSKLVWRHSWMPIWVTWSQTTDWPSAMVTWLSWWWVARWSRKSPGNLNQKSYSSWKSKKIVAGSNSKLWAVKIKQQNLSGKETWHCICLILIWWREYWQRTMTEVPSKSYWSQADYYEEETFSGSKHPTSWSNHSNIIPVMCHKKAVLYWPAIIPVMCHNKAVLY